MAAKLRAAWTNNMSSTNLCARNVKGVVANAATSNWWHKRRMAPSPSYLWKKAFTHQFPTADISLKRSLRRGLPFCNGDPVYGHSWIHSRSVNGAAPTAIPMWKCSV
ncbi:hypothetical protein M514_08914, partial [Trichuris suis]